MAREFSFRINADGSTTDVEALLLKVGFAEAESSRFSYDKISVWVREESLVGKESIKEGFGFEPSIRIIFRLDKFAGWEEGVEKVLSTCVMFIRKFGGEAVLLEDGEDPVLQFHDGLLALKPSTEFWTADRLAVVDLPYVVQPISAHP